MSSTKLLWCPIVEFMLLHCSMHIRIDSFVEHAIRTSIATIMGQRVSTNPLRPRSDSLYSPNFLSLLHLNNQIVIDTIGSGCRQSKQSHLSAMKCVRSMCVIFFGLFTCFTFFSRRIWGFTFARFYFWKKNWRISAKICVWIILTGQSIATQAHAHAHTYTHHHLLRIIKFSVSNWDSQLTVILVGNNNTTHNRAYGTKWRTQCMCNRGALFRLLRCFYI